MNDNVTGKKILVVDDDPSTIRLVQSRLEKEGFAVATANDGQKGLDQAQASRPDLIILDIEMPEMNGYTFVLKLRAIEALKGLPVIMLTSHDDMQPIFQFNLVKGYLVKPVNFEKLFEMIGRCLNN